MKTLVSSLFFLLFSLSAYCAPLQVGDPAPSFSTQTHEGKPFELSSRKGKGWTVLYFYPKADTPGCTKQACAFRDAIKIIKSKNAEIFGISGDEVKDIADFHKKHSLNFILLADPSLQIIESYGAKMPLLKMSKRWTFIIDPELNIRQINNEVDPAKDAKKVADFLTELQKTK